jgi:hypothetical protein
MDDYYIVSSESSGFALTIPDLGFGGHLIDGFLSREAAQGWLDSRREARQWIAEHRPDLTFR